MSDAGELYRLTTAAVESVNAQQRLAMELARSLTELVRRAPDDTGDDEELLVPVYVPWVELRRARAALAAIENEDW